MSSIKTFSSLGVLVSALTPSVYLGIDRGQMEVFDFYGSSSMRTLMEFLLEDYSNTQTDKKVAFNVSSIGSNAGLNRLLYGDGQFALVSFDVSKLHTDSTYKGVWENKKIKSIPLAKEAMVLLYKPPKGCTEDLVISKSNVQKIYSFFSGHKTSSGSPSSFKDLFSGDGVDKCDANVVTWVKSAGPTKSGTAKAFVDNPLLSIGQDSNIDTTWADKVKNSYGNDYVLKYAPESTALHWDSFKQNLTDGSMTYLPGHFVRQNWELIQSLGIKFAKYKKDDSSAASELSKDSSGGNNYDWTRSFSIVYSTSDMNNNTQKKSLLEHLVKNLSKLSDLNLTPYSYRLKSSSGSSASDASSQATEIDLTKKDGEDNQAAAAT